MRPERRAAARARRLFFAIVPSPAARGTLGDTAAALQRECGGRAVVARNLHLTLVFLGDVAPADVPRLRSLAASITAPCFDLTFDRAAYWRHNRLVWAAAAECPEPLVVLVAGMQAALAASGYRVDTRPYVPHITLLRNARRPPANTNIPAVAWPVSRFALMESVPSERGRAYEVIHDWALGG